MPWFSRSKKKTEVTFIEKAFNDYEKAFLPPVREAWGYLPRWNRQLDDAYINRIHGEVVRWQNENGETAESLFLLALLYKHCNQVDRYLSCIAQAHKRYPDHLETAIAQRDGVQYADPFYFPSWDELRDGKASLRAEILHHSGGTFMEQARSGARVFPVVVIKKTLASFRAKIGDKTTVRMITDMVSFPPGCEALLYIMPVVFDDPDDPYWTYTYLIPHQGGATLSGMPIIHRGPSVNLPHGDMALRMCRVPGQCGLIVIDEANNIVLNKLVIFDEAQNERLLEMQQVIMALGDATADLKAYQEYAEIHLNGFSIPLKSVNGREIHVPAGRSSRSNMLFNQVVAENGRLSLKQINKDQIEGNPGFSHDVFFSHAHKDSRLALAVRDWMKSIWPDLNIYLTDPDFEDKFEADPAYFIRELHKSRCILILATKLGLNRPAVQLELGAAKGKKVIVLYAGDVTQNDVDRMKQKDKFFVMDSYPSVVLGEKNFHVELTKLIADGLGRPMVKHIPDFSVSDFAESPADEKHDPYTSFADDYGKILESAMLGTRQVQENTVREVLERVYSRSDAATQKMLTMLSTLFEPRVVLLFLIAGSGIQQEKQVAAILGYIPKLVDMELYLDARVIAGSQDVPEEAARWNLICRAIKGMMPA